MLRQRLDPDAAPGRAGGQRLRLRERLRDPGRLLAGPGDDADGPLSPLGGGGQEQQPGAGAQRPDAGSPDHRGDGVGGVPLRLLREVAPGGRPVAPARLRPLDKRGGRPRDAPDAPAPRAPLPEVGLLPLPGGERPPAGGEPGRPYLLHAGAAQPAAGGAGHLLLSGRPGGGVHPRAGRGRPALHPVRHDLRAASALQRPAERPVPRRVDPGRAAVPEGAGGEPLAVQPPARPAVPARRRPGSRADLAGRLARPEGPILRQRDADGPRRRQGAGGPGGDGAAGRYGGALHQRPRRQPGRPGDAGQARLLRGGGQGPPC